MIDVPIVTIINAFNKLSYCFTLQSCYGHFVYNGQKDPHNLEPLPIKDSISKVEYRIAYIGFCIENSASGRGLFEYLKEITAIDLENVQFIGFVPHNEIQYAYQLAEFFVLVTLCESFGFPIVEAFATGCPAIVPSTCACPEVVGDAAKIVDPFSVEDIGDAIVLFSNSEETRNSYRAAGLLRVKMFSWEETCRRSMKVFDEMVPRT